MTSSNSFKPRKRNKNTRQTGQAAAADDMAHNSGGGRTSSLALDRVQMHPRTPKTPITFDEVELQLLGEDDRRQAALGLSDEFPPVHDPKRPFSARDKRAMVLLIVLCESIIA